MLNPSKKPWSNNPYAPQIPYDVHVIKKSDFAGLVIFAIGYGITIVLFFQCMASLLNPFDRTRGGIKWGLVAHAMLMLFNRAFPGNDRFLPGPYAHHTFVYSEAIFVVPGLMFQLNQWLADGLLLYRCHIIYGMNYWATAFPCLMYIASIAMGVLLTCIQFRPDSYLLYRTAQLNFATSWLSISLALNVLLTLMIFVRLIIHARNKRNRMGTQAITNGLYDGIVAILIESFALYSITLLLVTALEVTGNPGADFFNQIVPMAQVIAPFMIIVRVAKRSAVTSDDMSSGGVGLIRFRGQAKSADDNGTVPDGNPVNVALTYGEALCESDVRNENVIGEVPR